MQHVEWLKAQIEAQMAVITKAMPYTANDTIIATIAFDTIAIANKNIEALRAVLALANEEKYVHDLIRGRNEYS